MIVLTLFVMVAVRAKRRRSLTLIQAVPSGQLVTEVRSRMESPDVAIGHAFNLTATRRAEPEPR